jgi:hypothetical protein
LTLRWFFISFGVSRPVRFFGLAVENERDVLRILLVENPIRVRFSADRAGLPGEVCVFNGPGILELAFFETVIAGVRASHDSFLSLKRIHDEPIHAEGTLPVVVFRDVAV